MHCDLSTSIPEWIIEHPETTCVFAELELDVSCAGKSLKYVCQCQEISPSAVLAQLHEAIAIHLRHAHKD